MNENQLTNSRTERKKEKGYYNIALFPVNRKPVIQVYNIISHVLHKIGVNQYFKELLGKLFPFLCIANIRTLSECAKYALIY